MVLETDMCAEDLEAYRVDFKIKTIRDHEKVQAYSVWLRIHNGANTLEKGGNVSFIYSSSEFCCL